jgi:CelD/BcsL family acetyltransferase involved in cellulose biosynthesis
MSGADLDGTTKRAWARRNYRVAFHAAQDRISGEPVLVPGVCNSLDRFCPNARVAVLADGPDIVGFFPFQRRRLRVAVPIGFGINDCQGFIRAPG